MISRSRRPHTSSNRQGFTLIETIIALAILAGVVLTMAMNTTISSRNVSASGSRSRAQAMADQQISRARAWPTYGTLGDLTDVRYNMSSSNLTTSTVVTVDTSAGRNVTSVVVTVMGSTPQVLALPVKRSISIAAP